VVVGVGRAGTVTVARARVAASTATAEVGIDFFNSNRKK